MVDEPAVDGAAVTPELPGAGGEGDGPQDTAAQGRPLGTPASSRPQRTKNLPVRLKDYVLRRVREMKGGE